MRRLSLLPIVIALSFLLSACSLHLGLGGLLGNKGAGGNTGSNVPRATKTPGIAGAISIKNGKFRPKNVTVKVGTTVTWTNNDDVQQSVTSDAPGVFDSGPLASGASFQHTFAQAGIFPYHSTGAEASYGTVTVTP